MPIWMGDEVVLWHGTTLSAALQLAEEGPNLALSRQALDFGRGFYVTTREHRAVDWAWRQAENKHEPPAILRWAIAVDDFRKWPMMAFADAGHSADLFWEFVRFNRTKKRHHRPNGWFDVVMGPASSNFRGRIAYGDLDQLSVHTDDGIACLMSVQPEVFEVAP